MNTSTQSKDWPIYNLGFQKWKYSSAPVNIMANEQLTSTTSLPLESLLSAEINDWPGHLANYLTYSVKISRCSDEWQKINLRGEDRTIGRYRQNERTIDRQTERSNDRHGRQTEQTTDTTETEWSNDRYDRQNEQKNDRQNKQTDSRYDRQTEWSKDRQRRTNEQTIDMI